MDPRRFEGNKIHAPFHGKHTRSRSGSCLLQFHFILFSPQALSLATTPSKLVPVPLALLSPFSLSGKFWVFTWPVPISAQASPARNKFIDQASLLPSLFLLLASLMFCFYRYLHYLIVISLSSVSPLQNVGSMRAKLCLSSSPLCSKPLARRNCLLHICWLNDWIKGVWAELGWMPITLPV